MAAYVRYTEQLWFVYRALEEAAASSPTIRSPARSSAGSCSVSAALERDLDHLHGAPRGATAWSLCPRRRATRPGSPRCARDWPGGYVAHHYTRYLGDLSGGQVIRAKAEKTWGFTRKGDGVRFYVFEDIPNPAAFKRGYRELLDAVPADDLEKQRIVGECKRAFTLNTAVFEELGAPAPAGR